jgi:hypothetical protein
MNKYLDEIDLILDSLLKKSNGKIPITKLKRIKLLLKFAKCELSLDANPDILNNDYLVFINKTADLIRNDEELWKISQNFLEKLAEKYDKF